MSLIDVNQILGHILTYLGLNFELKKLFKIQYPLPPPPLLGLKIANLPPFTKTPPKKKQINKN
jgi:hypothetical protein